MRLYRKHLVQNPVQSKHLINGDNHDHRVIINHQLVIISTSISVVSSLLDETSPRRAGRGAIY